MSRCSMRPVKNAVEIEITVKTTEDILIPIDPDCGGEETCFADCPTDGEVVVSGALEETIQFGPEGTVMIDMGSDGSIDREFFNCQDADTCTE